MSTDKTQAIKTLVGKAAAAKDSGDALRFAQAALTVAQAALTVAQAGVTK